MNTTNLKKYAPQARREFMAAVSQRLNQFGIATDSKGKLIISTPVISGSVMQIGGMNFDAGLKRAREKLAQRAEQMGFEPLVEQMAYTWFNRLSAIRFMELHGYLDHNLRVLSHPEKANSFEILDHAQDVAADLGLDRNQIVELKLAGNQDEALYRLLLLGQCHQLHKAMPFLFEDLDDETELLLPDNLTRTDSILRGLVDSIPEEDWQQVEIIGWLYQFYISEKKDLVIGSVVKSEDIPAATQLFTPNWIVKYLVQNSVGRLWLMTYPDSGIKARMEYYIEPAAQEPSVVEALAAITPTIIDPETLKVLDPACGSGHILVEAYDILKAIYEERGYRVRDIPKLILEKNLYGLDIDDRAAQLAGFALMMKAREDDRRIFTRDIKLNVLAIQSTQNLDLPDLWRKLALNQDAKRGSMESIFDDVQSNLAATMDDIEFKQLQCVLALFQQAKTFGSLIQVPQKQAEFLQELTTQLTILTKQGDSFQKPAANTLLPLIHQAWLLSQNYDTVVANPPYMGSKFYDNSLKILVDANYKLAKGDLYTCFIVRNTAFTKLGGIVGMITTPNWMFLKSFEELRYWLFNEATIETFSHNGRGVFGSDFGSCAFTFRHQSILDYKGSYKKLFDKQGSVSSNEELEQRFSTSKNYESSATDFKRIPGYPIAYWAGKRIAEIFETKKGLATYATACQGLATADNNRFLKLWTEIDWNKIGFGLLDRNSAKNSGKKWFPYNKGGEFKKWYGNHDYVLNWEDDGRELWDFRPSSVIRNPDYYFRPAVSWSRISSSFLGVRFSPGGFAFDCNGPSLFPNPPLSEYYFTGLLTSKTSFYFLGLINPTLTFQVGDIDKLPVITDEDVVSKVSALTQQCVDISKIYWDMNETSWDFSGLELKFTHDKSFCLPELWNKYSEKNLIDIKHIKELEEEINHHFIEAYRLQNELSPEVPDEQITLPRADREKDCQQLISFAIGCMMGRYSLDEPGLIYAHASNIDLDPTRYQTFPADEDGILPLTDQEWFKDDASNRFREFLVAVWGEDTLQQNLEFVAESLTLSSFKPKKGETSLDTVRRYLSNQFYKDHLQTYKKRPIYWLFSSGKQKAFECLVYLHRYNESTLARMRTEYVTPLLGKYSAYADQLNQQLQDASSSEATRIKKDMLALEKKQAELRQFDDKLKHYADMRIKIDLDDGVKVNYGKFGDLLAEVKAVTGGTGD